MKLAYLLCFVLVLVPAVQAQCLDSYDIHEIFSAGGTKTYSLHGDRSLTATEVSIQECPTYSTLPTGSEEGGKTIISYYEALNPDNGKCRVNNSTGENHWFTFQGIKVVANGWKIQPQDLELSDIDVEDPVGGDQNQALRKASIVFGFNGNTLVWPTYTIPTGSLLRTQQFWIKAPQMGLLGFPEVHQYPYGVMWGQLTPHVAVANLVDCTTDQTQCRAIASFSEPVDGFFVLFAGELKSFVKMNAQMSVGPLQTTCGCRCDTSSPTDTRVVTRPVPGVSNQCTRSMITSSHLYCTDTGSKWCERGQRTKYVTTGSMLPGGNYPCASASADYAVQEISPFNP